MSANTNKCYDCMYYSIFLYFIAQISISSNKIWPTIVFVQNPILRSTQLLTRCCRWTGFDSPLRAKLFKTQKVMGFLHVEVKMAFHICCLKHSFNFSHKFPPTLLSLSLSFSLSLSLSLSRCRAAPAVALQIRIPYVI